MGVVSDAMAGTNGARQSSLTPDDVRDRLSVALTSIVEGGISSTRQQRRQERQQGEAALDRLSQENLVLRDGKGRGLRG